MVKKIQLKKGECVLIDEIDYKWAKSYEWESNPNNYAMRRHYFTSPYGRRKKTTISMHREIMGRILVDLHKLQLLRKFKNNSHELFVDHIDHDTLNNCRSNLRIVNNRQNQQNRRQNSSSKYPGVYWNKQEGKWRAYIMIKGKQHHLGYYNSENDAFLAYKSKVKEIGEEVI